MKKFIILLSMFVFTSAFSMSAFADSETVSSSSSVSNSTSESSAESSAYDDVSLGNGLRDNLNSGVGNVSGSADSALDNLANADFGSFIGRALASIPAEIWAAFVLMILCMIVRVALSIMAG